VQAGAARPLVLRCCSTPNHFLSKIIKKKKKLGMELVKYSGFNEKFIIKVMETLRVLRS